MAIHNGCRRCMERSALTGFLLITTREGKLVYISENVTDYLGHSMVDMKTQGDSLYDIVDKRDEASVRAHLLQGGKAQPDLAAEVAFFCRMNMSRTLKRQSAFGDVKVMHVKGHFLPLSDPSTSQQSQQQPQKYVFMATCSPLITPELKESLIQSNTMVFKTVHQMDMSFLEVTKTAEYHLGCSTEEICRTSWYSMLHPEDIHEAREKHVLLMRANHELGCMMTVRMLTMKGEILWVNMVMQVRQSTNSQNDDGLIVCINQVISEDEAFQVRMQSHMFSLYPPRTAELWNTATMGQPQTLQTDRVCWVPAPASSSSSSSMALPGPSLSNPMTPCQALAQPHQAMPAAGYIGSQQPTGVYHHSPPPPSSSSPTAVLSSSGHTDKLKQMLKRKLQGPCHPAKVPKLDENPRTRRSPAGGQRVEHSASTSPLQSSQFKMSGNVPGAYSWSAASQVTSHGQYQVAHALPVLGSHQQNVKAYMLASPPSRGSLSPPLTASVAYQGTEQVVPQSELKVVVPESFLTPDSSPASSPDPQTTRTSIKIKPGAVTPNAAVPKDLGQLAAFVQMKNPTTARSRNGTCIKLEQSVEECCHASCRKELPVMDASDIETFFHFLDSGKQFTAMDVEKTKQWQTTLQEITASLEVQPVFKAASVNAQTAHIKLEAEAMDQERSLPGGQLSQGAQKKAEQVQQSEADFRELEELLSFVSGEMTATQLNLDNLQGPPMATAEAEKLNSSQLQCSWMGGQICGTGHLDSFMLPGAGLGRPREGFSPVSPSDLSGEEDSTGEEAVDKVNKPVGLSKGKDGEKHGCAPRSGPVPAPFNAQAPQDVPGISEEDELYQLDKLLSLVASDSGVMLFQDSQ